MSSSSSSQIPNLLDRLRSQRAEIHRRRPSRRGRHPPPVDAVPPTKDPDITVQQTDNDAAGSRLSCVELGYLDDPFARAFSVSQQAVRRMPIINRGTYVRSVGIDILVAEFLGGGRGKRQIISLGAGTDTRPFRLLQARAGRGELIYHELDFAATVKKKIEAIERSPVVLSSLREKTSDQDLKFEEIRIAEDRTSLHSTSYTLFALDLRTVLPPKSATLPQIDPFLPTLILSECCLTYLEPETSSQILQRLLSFIDTSVHVETVLYEPIQPNDAFGRTMIANLASRDIRMPGLETLTTIEAHGQRLRKCGFGKQQGWTVGEAWNRWVSAEEKARLRRLEGLDEEEEWVLLAGHYALVRGVREGESPS